MTQTLIHVGFPKTGTTFLQEKYFPMHPDFFFHGWNSRKNLGEFTTSLVYDFDYDEKCPISLSETKVNVLSSESLSCAYLWHGNGAGAIDLRTAQRLHRVFGSAKILIVIRNQSSMISSLYFQYLAEGGDLAFHDFLINGLRGVRCYEGFRLETLRYDRLVSGYQDLFGKKNVLVLPYEFMKHDLCAFISEIEGFLGVKHYEPSNQFLNPSVKSRGVYDMYRLLNRLIPCGIRFSSPVRRVVSKLLRMGDLLGVDKSGYTISDDRLIEWYSASNAAVEHLTGLNLKQYGYHVGDRDSLIPSF